MDNISILIGSFEGQILEISKELNKRKTTCITHGHIRYRTFNKWVDSYTNIYALTIFFLNTQGYANLSRFTD